MRTVRDWGNRAMEAARAGLKKSSAFMQQWGFYGMLGVCVAVIIGTAIWTRGQTPPVQPPPEVAVQPQDTIAPFAVAQAEQQVIHWTTAAPTMPPPVEQAFQQGLTDTPILTWPVSGTVQRAHTDDVPVFLPTLGIWAVHDGIDIAARTGDTVRAAMSGTVSAAYSDPLLGQVMELAHPGGWTTRYAGLKTLELLRVGDPVKAGQTLSPLGDPLPLEADDAPHLHFELLRDNQWVDPETYLTPPDAQ